MILNANAQVYNYVPLEFQNMESNPAIMAYQFYKSRSNISYIWSAEPIKTFNHYNFSYSKLVNNRNAYGISIENAFQDIDELYRIAAIGAARNFKIANRWTLNSGLIYKFVKLGFEQCKFDYFEYTATNYKQSLLHTINGSTIIADTTGNYYLSLSYLNFILPFSNAFNNIEFPSYVVLNLGNSGYLLIPSGKLDLAYTGFIKSMENRNSFCHYINLGVVQKIGKYSAFKLGLRTGHCESNYYHINPYVSYSFKNLINLKFAYNYHAELGSNNEIKISTFQTSNTSIFP